MELELSVIDLPSKEDYNGEEYLEMCSGRGEYQRPEDEVIVFDQDKIPACTRYGLVHLNNGQNILEFKKSGFKYDQIDPKVVWEEGDKDKRLTSALAQLKKRGQIKGYVLLSKSMELNKKIETFKKSIDMGYYVYTGIDGVDRNKTNKPPYVIEPGIKGIGHAFSIVEYNDSTRLFKFINSFGRERGEAGYLYIKYDDVDKLMSAYSIIDTDNSGLFETFKNNQKARNALLQLKDMWQKLDDSVIRVQIHSLAENIRKTYKIKDI